MPATRRWRRASGRALAFLLSLLLLLLAAPAPSDASAGDVDPAFQKCVVQCASAQCERGRDAHRRLALPLRILRWTCRENCQYACMHDITAARTEQGEEVLQYFGKWPFHRLLGIQEPASVLFSILNGYVHYRGWQRLRRKIPATYGLRDAHIFYSLVHLNAWVWSTVFHMRDTYWTERLDYWSAAAAIAFGVYFAANRVFKLYVKPDPRRHYTNGHLSQPTYSDFDPDPDWDIVEILSSLNPFTTDNPPLLVWQLTCAALYIFHVGYLASLQRFDYGYNVVACAAAGMVSNVLWLAWAWHNRHREYAWQVAALVLGLCSAMSLELLDFPPVGGVLDAHALWHAATVPVAMAWYSFAENDMRHETRKGKEAVR